MNMDSTKTYSIEEIQAEYLKEELIKMADDMHGCLNYKTSICKIELPSGRIAEVQMVIECDEDEWIIQ